MVGFFSLPVACLTLLLLLALVPSLTLGLPASIKPESMSDKLRIVGGSDAANNDFPFVVRIFTARDSTRTTGFLCTGAIISKRHIITAAHCFFDTTVGTRLPDTNMELEYGDDIAHTSPNNMAVRGHVYNGYSIKGVLGDIAMVETRNEIAFSSKVQPIKFAKLGTNASSNDRSTPVPARTNVMAVGWGSTNPVQSVMTTHLQKVNLLTGEPQECAKILPAEIKDWSTLVCTTGTPGHDTCYGDSGGPLIVYERKTVDGEEVNVPALVGLTSFGDTPEHKPHPACGDKDIVAFYTLVSRYSEWVAGIVGVPQSSLFH
ncbi:trypsin-like serine protease [Ramicandelaber brevisporus]|nr:trypsin-like serine protease [Ramicandelaber brevisporus]